MPEKEGDFAYYVRLILRYKYLIVFVLLIFLFLGLLFFKYEVKTYTSNARILLERDKLNQKYELGNIQEPDTIISHAQSYFFIKRVVNNLNLTDKPIKNSLIERLLTGNKTHKLDLHEAVVYYLDNLRLNKQTNYIINIYVRTQYPELSAEVANEVAKLIIQDNKKEKELLLSSTLSYLNKQLKSVSNLIDENIKKIEEIETTPKYIEITDIKERIEDNQLALSVFKKERRSAQTRLALLDEDSEDYTEKKESYENQIDNAEDRIDELEDAISEDKVTLANMDKTILNEYKEAEFLVETYQDTYQSLLNEKQRISLTKETSSQNVKVLSSAYVPVDSDKTKGILIVIVFLGIGCGVSFGIIQLIEILNKRFKSTKDVEESTGLKVMGHVQKMKEKEREKFIKGKEHPKSKLIESYRTIDTNIKFATKGKKIKTIVFSSDKKETGKSLTVANLGEIMAEGGDKILLIGADLRRPKLYKMFNKKRKPGLTEVLTGKKRLKSAVRKIKKNLYLLPAGKLSYNPQSVLESGSMKKLMKKFKKYDFVFFDCIPLTSYTDVDIVASMADASILVVDSKKSNKRSMNIAKRRLKDVGSNIIGVVINRSKHGKDEYYYQYYTTKKPKIFKSKFKSLFSWFKKSKKH